MADKKLPKKGKSEKPLTQELRPELFVNENEFFSPAVIVQIHEPLPKDHETYKWVGRVASDWAHLEHLLDDIIWQLAGLTPPQGACITAQIMGLRPRCLTIIALATYRKLPVSLIERMTHFMNCSGDAADDRNRVVHDPWYLEKLSKTPAQLRSMPKGKPTIYGYMPRTAADMAKILNEIDRFRVWAATLRDDFHAACQTSPRKP